MRKNLQTAGPSGERIGYIYRDHGKKYGSESAKTSWNRADSPERLLERKEHWETVLNAWRQLPEQDRELLYQKYILEKSNEELARWLNCGKDSVRMRLTRIRRKILTLMKEADANDKT